MAGTMDDLFSEYEQISKAKLRAKKRRLHGGDAAEADSEDDEAAPVENPEGAEAEALKMATDAGHDGDDNKGGESKKEKKKAKEKSLNPDEFVRTTSLGKSEINSGEGGGEIGGEDCGIDDEEDGEVRSV